MNPLTLTIHEIRHRWKSSLLMVVIVGSLIAALTYFTVNNAGFQREIGRNARDIGSNVVILPAEVDQFRYHSEGGYSEVTMNDQVVQQLLEYKASLNHLIPMLERRVECVSQQNKITARLIGISASIPVPGRPKAPMQKAIKKGQVQLGATAAKRLGIPRDANGATVTIYDQRFTVGRINRVSGTWQDAAILIDLESIQTLLDLPNRLSRIEAIECTQEQCAATGLTSDVVLANELTRITDQAVLLRKEKMADARSSIRVLSNNNLALLRNALWMLLALAIAGLATLNSLHRQSEVGVLQSVGYGQTKVAVLFALRSLVLTLIAATMGIGVGACVAYWQSEPVFESTGNKFAVDWLATSYIGLLAMLLSVAASLLPAVLASTKHPAELIGRES